MDKVAACVLHGNDFVIRMQRGTRYRFTIERVMVTCTPFNPVNMMFRPSLYIELLSAVLSAIPVLPEVKVILSMAMRAPAFSVFPRKPNCMRLLPASWSSGRLTLVHSLEPFD